MDTTLKLPAALQATVDEAVARAVGERWASRIWSNDTSLWTDDPKVADRILHRLGWLHAPAYFKDEVAEVCRKPFTFPKGTYLNYLIYLSGFPAVPRGLLRAPMAS